MSTLLRILVLAAALAQAVVPVFLNPFRRGDDAVRAGPPSQIEPAGYAFSIWGVIYAGAVAYAVWQLLPAGRRDPATGQIAPLALIIYVGSSVWLASASELLPLWATMPILAVMAACATAALIFATRTPQLSMQRGFLVTAPFGLYAGWTVCATFVNIAEVAPQYGFERLGLSIPAYGVVSVLAALSIAGFILWRTNGNLAFALTVAWALIAIIVAAQTRSYDGAITFTASAALIAVALLAFIFRGRGVAPAVQHSSAA